MWFSMGQLFGGVVSENIYHYFMLLNLDNFFFELSVMMSSKDFQHPNKYTMQVSIFVAFL